MITIRYNVSSGYLPVTVTLIKQGYPVLLPYPENIHNSYGEYTFENIPYGNYILRFDDGTGCPFEVAVESPITTTTTTTSTTTTSTTTTSTTLTTTTTTGTTTTETTLPRDVTGSFLDYACREIPITTTTTTFTTTTSTTTTTTTTFLCDLVVEIISPTTTSTTTTTTTTVI